MRKMVFLALMGIVTTFALTACGERELTLADAV